MIEKREAIKALIDRVDEENRYIKQIITYILKDKKKALTLRELTFELRDLDCYVTENSLKKYLWDLRSQKKVFSTKTHGNQKTLSGRDRYEWHYFIF